jgi:cytosine/adenosine deaminase-related metal-dependent hydrolase
VIPPRSQRHLLVQGGTVVTQDANRRIVEADVLITDGMIVAVERGITPPSPTRLLNARDMAVIPGLIQPRALFEYALIRGLDHTGIGDLPHDDETAFWSGRLGAVELLTRGVTTVAGFELTRGMAGMRRALDETGIRVVSGRGNDTGTDVFSPADVDPQAWLDAVTIGNATRLGLDGKIGSVESGKAGDLTVVQVQQTGSFSHPDAPWPFRIRRGFDRAFIRWVVGDGEVLVDEGRLPHLDVEGWTHASEEAARKLLQRAT